MARSRETKIELTAYDDLFQTDESREEAKLSKRTNHVLHCEYTSTGENLPFLEKEYEVTTENGGLQMNGR